MQKTISIFTCFLFLLFSTYALADEDIVGQMSELKLGQKAPFDGMLLDSVALAKMQIEEEYKLKEKDLEKDKDLKLLEAKLNLRINHLIIEKSAQQEKYVFIIEEKDKQIEFLTQNLEKADNPNNHIWFALGVSGGIALVLITAISLNQISK